MASSTLIYYFKFGFVGFEVVLPALAAVCGHVPGEIHIEEDVWIGANCVITADVRIGRGAVVGAGAVVTRDVEPFSIVGGVPARPIGHRLEKKQQG